MAKDVWLPIGYEFESGAKIRLLLCSGNDWQIFNTNNTNNVLLARPELAKQWIEMGFLDQSQLGEVSFGSDSFCSLNSPDKYVLTPVEDVQPPTNKQDALAFARALRESRKMSETASFHDAIYVEQYSRLLPTWTLTPQVADELVLGTWITGGVFVSTNSFRRLNNLTGGIPTDDLAEIIQVAGYGIPTSANSLVKHKTISQTKTDKKTTTSNLEQPEDSKTASESKVFNLPGRPELEEFFKEHVIDIIFNPEKYQKMGIEFPSAIVLHGPPGSGKTFAVEQLVDFIDWPNYSIDAGSIGSPYIHGTSTKIAEVFERAMGNAPSVIVIDEMESFLSDRQLNGSSELHRVEEVAEFLRRIPEAIKNKVLIIAMTNLIKMIDPAILRRGRFDHVIEVSMPSRTEVTALLDALLSKLPKEKGLSTDKALDRLTGRALSDSAFVIREAARLAAKAGKSQLDQESIDTALNSLPKDNKDAEKGSNRIGFF